MTEIYPEDWPQFFTATILEWKPLLQEDSYKDIILKSLQFLVNKKKIRLYAFVLSEVEVYEQPHPPDMAAIAHSNFTINTT